MECCVFGAMDVPEDFECPVCGLGKTVFKKTAFEKEEYLCVDGDGICDFSSEFFPH